MLPQTASDPLFAWNRARRSDSEFDLLVAHQPTVAVGLRAAQTKVPLVLVYHASPVREANLRAASAQSAPRRTVDRLLAAVLRRVERLAVRSAQRVFVLSDYSRSLVVADHPDSAHRVEVVSGGVDTTAFVPGCGVEAARAALGLPAGKRLLVSIRRLEPRLGLETVLHAFRRLGPDSQIALAIVGDGILAPRLQALARELGIAARVRFVGRPSERELQDWYRAADLFVLPPAPHEGFGMATIEALASGTPAVAAPVGANVELLRPLEPRLIARTAEAGDLAAAIADVLTLVGTDLRARCREYACARFGWDEVMDVWERRLRAAAATAR